MIQIYHNPRCRKSREGLAVVQSSGQDYEVIEYLKTIPTVKDLQGILTVLKIKPIELIRKNEVVWKELFKGKDLSDKKIIEAMSEYPKLIERPIIIKGNKAIIGRPTEIIQDFLK